MNRYLILAALLCACGPDEDTMARVAPLPIGAVNAPKSQSRSMAGKTAAVQQGVYAPQEWIRPATMDAVGAQLSSLGDGGTSGYWISRLKGVTRKETFDYASIYVSVSQMTARYVVVICEYDDSVGLKITEATRGTQDINGIGSPVSRFLDIELGRPVTLYPDKKYAAAVIVDPIDVSPPGPRSAEIVGDYLSVAQGLYLLKSSDDLVDIVIPQGWDGQPLSDVLFSSNKPLVYMSRGRAIDSWY